jgi:hypothetical protein
MELQNFTAEPKHEAIVFGRRLRAPVEAFGPRLDSRHSSAILRSRSSSEGSLSASDKLPSPADFRCPEGALRFNRTFHRSGRRRDGTSRFGAAVIGQFGARVGAYQGHTRRASYVTGGRGQRANQSTLASRNPERLRNNPTSPVQAVAEAAPGVPRHRAPEARIVVTNAETRRNSVPCLPCGSGLCQRQDADGNKIASVR